MARESSTSSIVVCTTTTLFPIARVSSIKLSSVATARVGGASDPRVTASPGAAARTVSITIGRATYK